MLSTRECKFELRPLDEGCALWDEASISHVKDMLDSGILANFLPARAAGVRSRAAVLAPGPGIARNFFLLNEIFFLKHSCLFSSITCYSLIYSYN